MDGEKRDELEDAENGEKDRNSVMFCSCLRWKIFRFFVIP
jgi:hypothetical protein